MAERSTVLIVTDEGVTEVPGAIPWPTQLAERTERVLDAVLGPRPDRPQPRQEPD